MGGRLTKWCNGLAEKKFHGLIQHSFALRMPEDHRNFYPESGRNQEVEEYFSPRWDGDGPEFQVKRVGCSTSCQSTRGLAPHSPLVHRGLTNAKPWQLGYLARKDDGAYVKDLPPAFSWAGSKRDEKTVNRDDPDDARFIFADTSEGGEPFSNDFLVEELGCRCEAKSVSWALLELLAHRRSVLFGLALANRLVNVMLPHAYLVPAAANKGCLSTAKDRTPSWILQPLVSLFRAGRSRSDFGRMYSLTFFLIPVGGSCRARKMSEREIDQMVNAGWSLALSPQLKGAPRFDVDGPLPDYVSQLSQFDMRSPLHPLTDSGCSSVNYSSPTLRQAIEMIAFGVALRAAWDPTDRDARRLIGDDVVTSLGSARVSTVVAVDPHLTKSKVEMRMGGGGPPGCLKPLMETLAEEIRTPPYWSTEEQLKFRLDRHFVDKNTYALGVLPQNRCLVVASVGSAQNGRRESGLMQASNAAYMTIGSATAIGTMRSIERDLERTKDSESGKIAKVEHEIAGYLHEIYDLDITREAHRQLYRGLRDRLGITSDYETLQNKMETLYRATSTQHDVRAKKRVEWLTAGIVFLTVLVVLGTLALLIKPG